MTPKSIMAQLRPDISSVLSWPCSCKQTWCLSTNVGQMEKHIHRLSEIRARKITRRHLAGQYGWGICGNRRLGQETHQDLGAGSKSLKGFSNDDSGSDEDEKPVANGKPAKQLSILVKSDRRNRAKTGSRFGVHVAGKCKS